MPHSTKKLFLLAQDSTANQRPPAEHHGVVLSSSRGPEPPQSHHPGLPLSQQEEFQASGCLSMPQGSIENINTLQNTPRSRLPPPESRFLQGLELCRRVNSAYHPLWNVLTHAEGWMGRSPDARVSTCPLPGQCRQGAARPPRKGESIHTEALFSTKPGGFGFPHQYFLGSHPSAPRAVRRQGSNHITAAFWEDEGRQPRLSLSQAVPQNLPD